MSLCLANKRQSLASALGAIALVSACAGNDIGAVNGMVNGASLVVRDCVAYSTGSATAIALIDVGGICGYFGSNSTPKNSTALVIYFQNSMTTGSFSVGGASNVSADWSVSDATCTRSLTLASSGTVTITATSATNVTGEFDLSFGADHVSGRFNAATCSVSTDAGSPPTCS